MSVIYFKTALLEVFGSHTTICKFKFKVMWCPFDNLMIVLFKIDV